MSKKRVVPQRCKCGEKLPTTPGIDLLCGCRCGRRFQARAWGDTLAWYPFDERQDKLDRYADALDHLRLLMTNHGCSGDRYVSVDELAHVLVLAEEGGSKPVKYSQNDLALRNVTTMLDQFVMAAMSGSEARISKALMDYRMIFGQREFEIPEAGTCPQCGLPLKAALAWNQSTDRYLRVFLCDECGVPVIVDYPDPMVKVKPWVAERWEKMASDEVKAELEKHGRQD